MSRVQLALNVSNIDEAVAFYSKLFGTEVNKRKPGYANFAIDEPPLKLVLIEGEGGGTLNHLGVEVETAEEVEAAEGRLSADGHHHRCRRHHLLLRPQDRDVGQRPRRRPVGVVRQDRRRRADDQQHPHRRRERPVLCPRSDQRVCGHRHRPWRPVGLLLR
ncbi:MAG: VOC family protein [Microthrixaceae bacterium]